MDIAICGAGIAGLTAAALLGRNDHKVVIFERFESPAPVGSGLIIQATGQAVLSDLGAIEALRAAGAPIKRLFGTVARTGRAALDVRFQTNFGYGVHRAALFDILFETARANGAEIEFGRKVAGANDRDIIFAAGQRSGPFDLIIDASGLRSPFIKNDLGYLDYGALWANVRISPDGPPSPDTLEQRYEFARKTAGLLPIGRDPGTRDQQLAAFFWSLRHDAFDEWRNRGIEAWKDDVFALWPELGRVLDAVTSADDLVFAHYAHRSISKPVDGRIIHIGDAWHAASPQLGQGANMAMLDAYALNRALSESSDLNAAMSEFRRMRSRHVWLYQTVSGLFTPFYQSDSRALALSRDYLLTPMSQLRPAQRFLSNMVSGKLGLAQELTAANY